MKYSLFIFRRDFRIVDNKGFNFAMENCKKIIPIFIFTPEQVVKNKYKSDNAIQFMIESLKNLNSYFEKLGKKLFIFQGDNIDVIKKLLKVINIENIIYNIDYTPYARERDDKIKRFCESSKINCHEIEDYLLFPIGTLLKKNDEPYTVFTPFRNNGYKFTVDKPVKKKIKNLAKIKLKDDGYIEYKINEKILVKGGRKEGLKVLKKVKNQENYNEDRNILTVSTTQLSAYIKFGCVSIREVYWKIMDILGIENSLISQLFWREFYFYVVYYYPYVLKGKNFNPKYNGMKWNKNMANFKKWCKGETGYPIVDAGMRELNTTGYMHNRARLITSNFLNRMLGYNWTVGEKYYATALTDYDPSVNNGNWQWIASTGTDPKPYFQRLFNPWLQSKKFDPDALYIKKWIPELKDVSAKHIHEWDKYHTDVYISPIVNYKEARKKSIDMYRSILK